MKKYKILIIDDDSSVLLALKSFLEPEGYDVFCSEDIKTATNLLRSFIPDLFIIDIYLKDGNGIEFLKDIKEKYKINKPVIIFTGAPGEENFKESFKNYCDFFLQKDKAIPHLLTIIKRILDSYESNIGNFKENEYNSLKPLTFLMDLIKKKPDMNRILIKIDSFPLFQYQNFFKDSFPNVIEEMLFNFLYNFQKEIPPSLIEAYVTETGWDITISLQASKKEERKIRDKVKIATINTIKFMREKIKNNFHFFDVKIVPLNFENKNIRLELYRALQMKENTEPIPLNSLNYEYYIQGIFETSPLKLKGFEVFSRPENFHSVERFYKKLEKLRIHGHMDNYNLKNIKRFLPSFSGDYFFSVNISPSSLLINGFSRNIIQKLGNFCPKICLEFTERAPNLTEKTVKEKITYLKKNGFLIAIDDVGAGYNNLSSILNIEPDIIKIDKILIKKIAIDSYKKETLKAILDLSKKVGFKVCAEGVEEEKDYQILQSLKPDFLQGFYLHYPEKIVEENYQRKVC